MSDETFGQTVEEPSGDYNIKVEGEKSQYGNGATRCIKAKGRFDLIPEDVYLRMLDYEKSLSDEYATQSIDYTLNEIEKAAWDHQYIRAIILLMLNQYKHEADKNDMTNWKEIFPFFNRRLLADLAIHFQKGAKIYGPRNCQMGLPIWQFRDSGLRHLGQMIMGYEDENHFMAAVWNFWLADWSNHNQPLTGDDIVDCVVVRKKDHE